MIDTHCHLWFKHFEGEIPEVVERAKKAGVGSMICVGCDEESSRRSVELAKEYDGVYASVGLHPTDTDKWDETKTIAWMRVLIELNRDEVLAVGETGIDYYRKADEAEIQKIMFREQCLLAQEFDLPVIVHLRMTKHGKASGEKAGEEHFSLESAELDCLHVLEEVDMQPEKVIFHCFSGDRMMAEAALDRGWILSFSGTVTYSKAIELREVVKITPLDQLLVETDCPFLTPQSKRKERNEPAFVVETAKMLAELKGLSYEELDQQITENVRRVFF